MRLAGGVKGKVIKVGSLPRWIGCDPRAEDWPQSRGRHPCVSGPDHVRGAQIVVARTLLEGGVLVARLTLAAGVALPFLLIAACGDIDDPLGIDSRRGVQPDSGSTAPAPTTPSPTGTSTADPDPDPVPVDGGVTEAGVDAGKPKPDAGKDAAPPVVEVSLSDLTLTVASNGLGPLEKNMSNGEAGAGDGKPLTLEGVVYSKGIGVHAASEFSVNLGGAYKSFSAAVGVDDEVAALGSVVFQVKADGALLFDSGMMTGATPTKTLKVDVTGKNTLTLIVTDGGDGNTSDHGDWCAAKLTK